MKNFKLIFENENSLCKIDIINMSEMLEYVNKYVNKQSIKSFNLTYQEYFLKFVRTKLYSSEKYC